MGKNCMRESMYISHTLKYKPSLNLFLEYKVDSFKLWIIVVHVFNLNTWYEGIASILYHITCGI